MTTETSSQQKTPRRHDLDALRAIAMIMGIVLHATYSFYDPYWGITDVSQLPALGQLFSSIHGWRMPLFFMMSGFFTMMLWRKRGAFALLNHRYRRVFLPFVVSVFVFIPLTIIARVDITRFTEPAPVVAAPEVTLWTEARAGNIAGMQSFINEGLHVNAADPEHGNTAVMLASFNGHVEAVDWLVEQGADVNAVNNAGMTALSGTISLGRANTVGRVLAAGAELPSPDEPHPITLSGNDTRAFASSYGVSASIVNMTLGKVAVSRVLTEFGDPTVAQQNAIAQIVNVINESIFLYHLWFLWQLCLQVLAFAAIMWLLGKVNLPHLPRWMMMSPFNMLWLIPLTLIPQSFMTAYGPDLSGTIFPDIDVLVYYFIFFNFGAYYFTLDDRRGDVARGWWIMLPVAIFILFPIGYAERKASYTATGDASLWSAFLIVTYAWFMVLGLTGLFRVLFSGESKAMRYLSDSSYWLYLAHLPLVIVLQRVVSDWQLPALVKFIMIIVVTTAILLAMYDLFVRYTFIGTFLNGPRQRPERAPKTPRTPTPAAEGAD
ncbi:MAG: acyltransferase family protein [Chloroflexota bacterium]